MQSQPKLSDVPWDDLQIGDKCTSARGTPGKITKLEKNDRYVERDHDHYEIEIDWDNGNKSHQKHYMMNHVTYVGR